ncbi:MAG: transaldolase family protein [Thermofilaceae archaeon]
MVLSKEFVSKLLDLQRPEELMLPIEPRVDHADHMVKTALLGWSELAADHILHFEVSDKLPALISSLVRKSEILLRTHTIADAQEEVLRDRVACRVRIYDMLIETALNLAGCESDWAYLEPLFVDKALSNIVGAFKEWEKLEERELGGIFVLETVVERKLRKMEKVNKGNSLVAAIAKLVRERLEPGNLAASFIESMAECIRGSFYRRAYEQGLCKFGNDYALGLRFLRHLGFVQVSTNPLLAARAYDDEPELWRGFEEYTRRVLVVEHPEWFNDPENHLDELAMEATRYALMDNFYVFRVPFILSGYHDGLVSYQLNPLIAHDAERSVEAVKVFANRLERDLKVYDEYLWWGYNVSEKGRPNLVVKVAAAYPAAIEIVEKINEMGIGQNITLSYTVSQEVLLGVSALKGMGKAISKGLLPTQTYNTNMSGRLEDHLREVAATDLLLKGLAQLSWEERWAILDELASKLGVKPEEWSNAKSQGIKTAVEFLCSTRVLGRNMTDARFLQALAKTNVFASEENMVRQVSELEEAIKLSGTLIAKRVYEIFFAPWNRSRWIEYLVKEVGIDEEDAEIVLDRLDLLPASKRKPADTLLTFSSRNVTNTEFPDHQLNVERVAKDIRFDDICESILKPVEERHIGLLRKIPDFVRAYEASPEVNELLHKVGIKGDYGSNGISPADWPSYGPCLKTLNEFTYAYTSFRWRVAQLAKSIGKSG